MGWFDNTAGSLGGYSYGGRQATSGRGWGGGGPQSTGRGGGSTTGEGWGTPGRQSGSGRGWGDAGRNALGGAFGGMFGGGGTLGRVGGGAINGMAGRDGGGFGWYGSGYGSAPAPSQPQVYAPSGYASPVIGDAIPATAFPQTYATPAPPGVDPAAWQQTGQAALGMAEPAYKTDPGFNTSTPDEREAERQALIAATGGQWTGEPGAGRSPMAPDPTAGRGFGPTVIGPDDPRWAQINGSGPPTLGGMVGGGLAELEAPDGVTRRIPRHQVPFYQERGARIR